jgi:SM-20-related protein
MNSNWQTQQGGNLRILLNSQHDIADVACEIIPKIGTLVVFECAHNAWHGHLPFVGVRQSLQFNYVKNNRYLTYEKYRHRLSAFIKQLRQCWH